MPKLTVGKLDSSNMVSNEFLVDSVDEAVKKSCELSLTEKGVFTICKDSHLEDGEVMYLAIGGQFYRPIEPLEMLVEQ
ncbi:hypothetical protein EA007_00565 [Vibrio anguillarum]|uniref:hypothetical protein n=1 Tax=Vibrio anguillarum TaxID=55601 RepID=UPI00188C4A33|nr:hypothetical protein [Vibrio anguillarum]MBF4249524.1 hypothetical protein [Vibrio anguillarum]